MASLQWDIEHHHSPIANPNVPLGNGMLLWFEVAEFDAAVARALQLQAEIVLPRHRNPPNRDSGPNYRLD